LRLRQKAVYYTRIIFLMFKTKIRALFMWQRVAAATALALLIALSFTSILVAQTVTQGYKADRPLQRGMIVKLKSNDSSVIEPVDNESIEHMHGVVVDANDAPVTLSGEGQQTFVATIGHFDVLVSNQNGPIAVGDYITISALPGIGMKAGDKQPMVAGKALGTFDGTSNVVGQADLKEGNGSRKVAIGRVRMDLGVASNPLVKPTDANLPRFLEKTAEAIANKPVSPAKVYLSLAIFLATAMITGTVLYAGLRSSIIAIGRNPLSKKSINKSMAQVILTGLIIFISGTFGVYLLLRL
jgi:hypothetical protein